MQSYSQNVSRKVKKLLKETQGDEKIKEGIQDKVRVEIGKQREDLLVTVTS